MSSDTALYSERSAYFAFDKAEITINNVKIKTSEIMREIFSEKFDLDVDYKTSKLNHFEDGKNILLKEFPVLQQNLSYFEHLQKKIETFNQKVLYARNFNYSKIFTKFMNTLSSKIVKFYEDFYAKTMNKDNQISSKDLPKELNFPLLRNILKDRILKVSNELYTVLSTKPQTVYEEEFMVLCEKIIRLNEYLHTSESTFIPKTKINYGALLTGLCTEKYHELSGYICIDHERLDHYLNDPQPQFAKHHPIYMSKRKYILESLHKIITDDLDKDLMTTITYDIEAVARAVFQRDHKIIEQDLTDAVRRIIDNKELKDDAEDFKKNIDGLTNEMQRVRMDGELLGKNPVYFDLMDGKINVEMIGFMEENEQNEDLLMHLEKLACDYYKYMRNVKDIFERMMFFTKEEELFYKNKYFQVLNGIIQNYYSEISKNSVETTINNFFSKLNVLLIKEKNAVIENEIEGKLLNELEKNENNPYLIEMFTSLQEAEKKRQLYSNQIYDKNNNFGHNKMEKPPQDEVKLKLTKEASNYVYKELPHPVSPLMKSRSMQINTHLLQEKVDFSTMSPNHIKKPDSLFKKNEKEKVIKLEKSHPNYDFESKIKEKEDKKHKINIDEDDELAPKKSSGRSKNVNFNDKYDDDFRTSHNKKPDSFRSGEHVNNPPLMKRQGDKKNSGGFGVEYEHEHSDRNKKIRDEEDEEDIHKTHKAKDWKKNDVNDKWKNHEDKFEKHEDKHEDHWDKHKDKKEKHEDKWGKHEDKHEESHTDKKKHEVQDKWNHKNNADHSDEEFNKKSHIKNSYDQKHHQFSDEEAENRMGHKAHGKGVDDGFDALDNKINKFSSDRDDHLNFGSKKDKMSLNMHMSDEDDNMNSGKRFDKKPSPKNEPRSFGNLDDTYGKKKASPKDSKQNFAVSLEDDYKQPSKKIITPQDSKRGLLANIHEHEHEHEHEDSFHPSKKNISPLKKGGMITNLDDEEEENTWGGDKFNKKPESNRFSDNKISNFQEQHKKPSLNFGASEEFIKGPEKKFSPHNKEDEFFDKKSGKSHGFHDEHDDIMKQKDEDYGGLFMKPLTSKDKKSENLFNIKPQESFEEIQEIHSDHKNKPGGFNFDNSDKEDDFSSGKKGFNSKPELNIKASGFGKHEEEIHKGFGKSDKPGSIFDSNAYAEEKFDEDEGSPIIPEYKFDDRKDKKGALPKPLEKAKGGLFESKIAESIRPMDESLPIGGGRGSNFKLEETRPMGGGGGLLRPMDESKKIGGGFFAMQESKDIKESINVMQDSIPLGGEKNNDFMKHSNLMGKNKIETFDDDLNVLDDLLPSAKKGGKSPKKMQIPLKKEDSLMEEGYEGVQEEIIDDYKDDFHDDEDSGMLKKHNDTHQHTKSKTTEKDKDKTSSQIEEKLKFEIQKLLTKEDLKYIDNYIETSEFLPEHLELELLNEYGNFSILLEEFTSQQRAFFFTMDEGEKLGLFLEKFHDGFMKNGKNALKTSEKDINSLTEEFAAIYLQLTEKADFDLEARIFIPFEKPATIPFYLVELYIPAQKIYFYYKKTPTNDKKHQDKLKTMMALLAEIFKFDEQLKNHDIVISPSSAKELDKHKVLNYLGYLATCFVVLYETDENTHFESPKIEFDKKTFERMFLIINSTNTVFQLMEKSQEMFLGYFEGLINKMNDGKTCYILYQEFEMQEESDADKISQYFYQLITESMKKVDEIEHIFICLVIATKVNRYAYYVHLSSTQKKNNKPVVSLFYLLEYEAFLNEIILQVFNSVFDDNFIFSCFFDFSRHNGIYEYSRISIAIWAVYVLSINMDAIDAFRVLSYSLIPFYGESLNILAMMEEGGEGESGMDMEEGINYGDDFEVNEDLLPEGEV